MVEIIFSCSSLENASRKKVSFSHLRREHVSHVTLVYSV